MTLKIHERVNFVWNLLVYLISAVSSSFSNSILSRLRMLLSTVNFVMLLYLVQPESSRIFRCKVYKRIGLVFRWFYFSGVLRE